MPRASANPDAAFAAAARTVRALDRDRYFASLFAPPSVRGALFALHAFDLTLLEIVRTTTEPQLGLIRLAWWRDAAISLAERPQPGQPVLAALAGTTLSPTSLAALAESYMDALDGGNAADCGERLFVTAAECLGTAGNAAVAAAGRYWGAAAALRLGASVDIPAREPIRFEPAVRPITALAAVSRRDFAGRREPRGAFGRLLAMFGHMATGRA